MKLRSISLTMLLCAAAMASAQTYQLKLSPKAGAIFAFKYKAVFQAGGAAATATSDHVDTIKSVADNGDCTYEWVDKNFTIVAGGETTPVGDQGAVSAKLSSLGELLDVTAPSDDQAAGFSATLTLMRFSDKPVKVGDSWDFQTKGTPAIGLPALKAHYTFAAAEKVDGIDALKIDVDIEQQGGDAPVASKGSMWIDPTTGWLVKADLNWKNFPAAEGLTTDVHVTMDRQT